MNKEVSPNHQSDQDIFLLPNVKSHSSSTSLEHLNPSQKNAVLKTDGPVMILAGAGSGKTRTLVARMQYLMDEKEVRPYQILAVTFSNKAAREMRERLASRTSFDRGALNITTFHAFCAKVLRTEATYIGLSRNFTIYDDSESMSIIKSLMNKRGISQKEISPYVISQYIDGLKNLGFYLGAEKMDYPDIEPFLKEKLFFDIFQEYESELHRSNAVDFGGLITGVIQLFKTFPETLRKYQQKFNYLLVDEYQDTNRAQFDLILKLSHLHRNICVVGDEDQSIYSWRGADIRNILDFEKFFPDAELIKLEQNYRSSKKIIEAASHVISYNKDRKGKKMWTENSDGEEIRLVECKDDRAESEFIAKEIVKLKEKNVSFRDIAIFYRNNAQSRTIEDSLRREKFPYRVVAGIKFYDRKEIKDLISYMKVVVNRKDSLSLTRIINTPARGIGATSLRKLEDEAVRLNVSMFEVIEKIVESQQEFTHLKLSSKIKSSLSQFVSLIQEVRLLEESHSRPSLCYEKLLSESGYLEVLKADKTYEGSARLENLEELMNAIHQFEQTESDLGNPVSLSLFLESVTLDTSVSEEDENDQISLMTVHGSKGLEYPYVFLVGAEDNIFPSYKSLELGPRALEEERRLFYVAMTRAMKQLTITFALGRLLWGSLKFNGPSQFIYEIPGKYYKRISYPLKQKKKSQDNYDDEHYWDDEDDEDFEEMFRQSSPERVYIQNSSQKSRKPSSLSAQSSYQAGQKVVHGIYGEGVVLSSEGVGQDEKVTLQFQGGVKKKFLVKFAPLKRL